MPIFATSPRPAPRMGDAIRAALQSRAEGNQIRPANRGAERIPLYSGGELAAFVRRTGPIEAAEAPASDLSPAPSSDLRTARAIAAQWQFESGIAPAQIGVFVSEGIVRLTGTVETVHDKMALCRIAAAMGDTLAIVDELWVTNE
ncbi:MAG: hypothetical protein ACREFS_02490 [Acetobacteraceae bacterium]